MLGTPPANLEPVDPRARLYPPSWRDAAVRALFVPELGVLCTGCNCYLRTRAELRLLEADHIHPWSQGGLTTWENLHLLCRACNRTKSDKIQVCLP
jgi:5-methylcytosine-specific restriction endonuclease McrA